MMFSRPPLSLLPLILVAALAESSTCPLYGNPPVVPTCAYPPDPYAIGASSGKDLGVFAHHDLSVGIMVLREAPIFTISLPKTTMGPRYPLPIVTQLVRPKYELLSGYGQHEVLNLHFYDFPWEFQRGEGWDDILGYNFRTNAYDTRKEIGLFPKIARINHSCRPNAGYVWNKKIGKRVIYANTEIKKGEEIFDSYIPLLLGKIERQKKLERYGVTCTCSACSQNERLLAQPDQRRKEVASALTAFSSQLTLTFPDTTTSFVKARRNARSSLEHAKLVEDEGLADYYAQAYRIVAMSHARVQDWEQATIWANKGYETRVMEDGSSGWTMEMRDLTSGFY